MYIYNYDENTMEYLFASSAQKNPVRQDEYLCPKNSTTVAPPDLKNNEAAVFNGEFWNIIPDYRGCEVINKDTHERELIESLGPLPDGFLLYEDYILSDEYKNYQKQKRLEEKRAEILSRISEIDKKRVRAVCEPSLKDEITGLTWLEFYNNKILELRNELSEVGYDT